MKILFSTAEAKGLSLCLCLRASKTATAKGASLRLGLRPSKSASAECASLRLSLCPSKTATAEGTSLRLSLRPSKSSKRTSSKGASSTQAKLRLTFAPEANCASRSLYLYSGRAATEGTAPESNGSCLYLDLCSGSSTATPAPKLRLSFATFYSRRCFYFDAAGDVSIWSFHHGGADFYFGTGGRGFSARHSCAKGKGSSKKQQQLHSVRI
eukprot:TRINITY_DN1398_c0_g1_i3.p2 TRINITY_DN1398_c0_g1~~TRINITY_DN1398_c0_g1_i3.p2  ORF type:complete len:211 (-),score=47.04 TRINITY_DN1398_c0_g1_i3:44-676(-)